MAFSNSGTKASLTGKDKLQRVAAILAELREDVEKHRLSQEKRESLLEELKIYGRDVNNSDPIYTKNGLEVLTKEAFDDKGSTVSKREALSCIANALFLNKESRRILADINIIEKAISQLKSSGSHDEFLISRILFLLTYVDKEYLKWEPIVREQGLADAINEKLRQHSTRYTSKQHATSTINPMDDNALKETAVLLFNISHLNPQASSLFSPSITPLFAIVNSSSESQALQQPIPAVMNALLPLDEDSSEWISSAFPDPDPNIPSSKIISFIAASFKQYPEHELESKTTPILTLIHKLYSTAPDPVKAHIRTAILPSETDRAQVLGRSSSLSSQLLRVSMSPTALNLSESAGNLLYELSDKDPSTFVGNVGFGVASGYLMNHGIPLPSTPGSQTVAGGVAVNPITGQRRDAEFQVEEPPMTDEEKEREAERLFVLFERLNRTGVMSVQNPVRQAMEEGRLEELPDDTPVDE